jgi:hypothetical protein
VHSQRRNLSLSLPGAGDDEIEGVRDAVGAAVRDGVAECEGDGLAEREGVTDADGAAGDLVGVADADAEAAWMVNATSGPCASRVQGLFW